MKTDSINKNNFKEIIKRMEQVYSHKYGLATRKRESEFGSIKVSTHKESLCVGNVIPMFHSMVKNPSYNTWEGTGTSLDKERSLIKAYGEFIERSSAHNPTGDHPAEQTFNSYNNLRKHEKCLDLGELIYFDKQFYQDPEFPYSMYTRNSPISWVKGKNLTDNIDTWLPAQKVFLGTNLLSGEKQYITWLSTGLSCGEDYYHATVGGIYEVIERDSFMLTWLLRLSGKRVIMDQIKSCDLIDLYNHICNSLVGGDKLYIYDISRTEGVYTILTFIRNDIQSSFGLIVSASSNVNVEKAILSSLEELCQTQAFAYSRLIYNKNRYQQLKKKEITDLHLHTLYYSTGLRGKCIDFLTKSNKKVKLSDMKEYHRGSYKNILEYLINILNSNQQIIYVADITKKEIQQCGFCVVRVIMSDYNDLDVSHLYRELNNKRLIYYKKKYSSEINIDPHPFP